VPVSRVPDDLATSVHTLVLSASEVLARILRAAVIQAPLFRVPEFPSPFFRIPIFGTPDFQSPVFQPPVFQPPVFQSSVFRSTTFGAPVSPAPDVGRFTHPPLTPRLRDVCRKIALLGTIIVRRISGFPRTPPLATRRARR